MNDPVMQEKIDHRDRQIARLTLELENARNDALAAESALAKAREANAALEAKVRSLAPHGTCGCSYDSPDDVCLHHSPRLAAAEAELAKAREALQRIVEIDGPRSGLYGNIARAALAREEKS